MTLFLISIICYTKPTDEKSLIIIYPKNGATNVKLDGNCVWTWNNYPKPPNIKYSIYYKKLESEKYLNEDILYNDTLFKMILWNLINDTKYSVYMMCTTDNINDIYSDTITFTTKSK